MAQTTFTFEEIDSRINSLKLDDFQPGGPHHFTTESVQATPGDVLQKICAIYQGIRPILIILATFPLIPKKWRDAIKVFTDLMDNLCPGS